MSEGVSTLAFIQREGLGCLIGSVPRMLHAFLALHASVVSVAFLVSVSLRVPRVP